MTPRTACALALLLLSMVATGAAHAQARAAPGVAAAGAGLQPDLRGAPAPVTLVLNCDNWVHGDAAYWGGQRVPATFDAAGRTALDVRFRRKAGELPMRFILCYDGKVLRDVSWVLPPGLDRRPNAGTNPHAVLLEPQGLAGESGERHYKIGVRGTLMLANGASRPFEGALDLALHWVLGPEMLVTAVEREDYRPHRSGVRRNEGVLDPGKLQQPDPSAGRFTLVGRQLAGPGTTVLVGGEPAVVEQQAGTGVEDRVVVRAAALGSGPHIVVRRGDFAAPPVPLQRRAYRAVSADDFAAFLGTTQLVFGSPRGSGQVSVLGQVTAVPLDAVANERGLTLHLNDLRSRAVRIATGDAGEGSAELRIEVEFESDGNELEGTLLEEIDVFRCAGYTIERSRCSVLDAACVRQALGAAATGAGQCLQPSAWAPQRVAGPSRPVHGQLDDARVRLWIALSPDRGSGSTVGKLTRVEFHSKVALAVDGAALPLSAEQVQTRIRRDIEQRLQERLVPLDLGRRVAEGVHRAVALTLREPRVLGYYALRGGSGLVADLSVGP